MRMRPRRQHNRQMNRNRNPNTTRTRSFQRQRTNLQQFSFTLSMIRFQLFSTQIVFQIRMFRAPRRRPSPTRYQRTRRHHLPTPRIRSRQRRRQHRRHTSINPNIRGTNNRHALTDQRPRPHNFRTHQMVHHLNRARSGPTRRRTSHQNHRTVHTNNRTPRRRNTRRRTFSTSPISRPTLRSGASNMTSLGPRISINMVRYHPTRFLNRGKLRSTRNNTISMIRNNNRGRRHRRTPANFTSHRHTTSFITSATINENRKKALRKETLQEDRMNRQLFLYNILNLNCPDHNNS